MKTSWCKLKSVINLRKKSEVDSLPSSLPSVLVDNWLYLGDANHARSRPLLAQLAITHVVNAAGEISNFFPEDFVYCSKIHGIRDSCDYDMSQYFDLANNFINEAKDQAGRVLIHCAAGVSRSATISIAYFIATNRWTALSSFAYCQKRRPQIAPNAGFQLQLIQYAISKQANQAPRDLFPDIEGLVLFLFRLRKVAPIFSDLEDVSKLFLTIPIQNRKRDDFINIIASEIRKQNVRVLESVCDLIETLYQQGFITRIDLEVVFTSASLAHCNAGLTGRFPGYDHLSSLLERSIPTFE